jgi:signal transduction histidine kinase
MQASLPGFAPLPGASSAPQRGRRVDVDYAPRIRAERLIATGRVVLACFSLLAVWLDPTTPTKYVQITYLLLGGYVVYAVALAGLAWLARAPSPSLALGIHIADLALFSVFIYLTEGPASPFFTYFIFAVVGATLRWQWRGAVWTAAAALVAFNGIGLYAAKVIHDPEFELDRFLIRTVYLVVLASLLAFLGAYEQRRRNEMSRLAAWPRARPADRGLALRQVLESAAHVLGAPRALLVWEEADEPWLRLVAWSGGGDFREQRDPPGTFHPLVAEQLDEANFLCHDVARPAATVLRASDTGPEPCRGAPIHPALVSRFAMKVVLSLCVRGECVDGRLFALGKRHFTADDLVLGEVVVRHVTESLDHLVLSRQLQQAAATEERVRLSRDLHDGVLQSLTGAALKLETAQRLLEHDPATARQRLAEIQRLIVEEQRNLRFFIRDSKLAPLGAVAGAATLDARLRELGRRLETVWGLAVELELDGLNGTPDSLASDICHIVHEALVNAARHADASHVRVSAGAHEDQVDIVVTDNGRGFPFHGDFDHHALAARQLGPVMLKARIESLGGTLAIHSSPAGARLEIRLPCPRVA